MLLGAKRRLQDTYELFLNADNEKIEKVSKQKLLGIFIDENLTWTPHINHLCTLISSKISLLKQLSSYVPNNIQNIFYQSYILPSLIMAVIHGALPRAQISNASPSCKNAPPALFCKQNI